MSASSVSPMATPSKRWRNKALAGLSGEAGCSRITVKKHADTMNSPSSAASIAYSGQCACSAAEAVLATGIRLAGSTSGIVEVVCIGFTA